MALPSSDRRGSVVIWICLHTAEGARTKEDLYAYFNRNQNASSHVGIDGYGISPEWVSRLRYAWTLLNGNPISMNAELCGFAGWSRAQWLSTGWVDGVWNPRNMVRNAALWAKRECEYFGVPKTHIGVSGVRNRQKGIIDHDDYSDGTGDGTHWDVGENFPWDVFFTDMGLTETEEDDMYSEKDRARDNHLAYRLDAFVKVLDTTGDDPNAPQPPERVQAAIDLNSTKWRLWSLLHLLEEGDRDTVDGEPFPFVTAFKDLQKSVAALTTSVAKIQARLDQTP